MVTPEPRRREIKHIDHVTIRGLGWVTGAVRILVMVAVLVGRVGNLFADAIPIHSSLAYDEWNNAVKELFTDLPFATPLFADSIPIIVPLWRAVG